MNIFLDSQNQAILTIVELCCERLSYNLSKDVNKADFIIKDFDVLENIEDFDKHKTIFIFPKDISDNVNVEYKITKPFLPTALIKILIKIENSFNKVPENINEINHLIDEIDELDKNVNNPKSNKFIDESLDDFSSLEDIADDFEKKVDLNFQNENEIEIDDNISLEDLAHQLEKEDNFNDEIEIDDNISLEDLAKNFENNNADVMKNSNDKILENTYGLSLDNLEDITKTVNNKDLIDIDSKENVKVLDATKDDNLDTDLLDIDDNLLFENLESLDSEDNVVNKEDEKIELNSGLSNDEDKKHFDLDKNISFDELEDIDTNEKVKDSKNEEAVKENKLSVASLQDELLELDKKLFIDDIIDEKMELDENLSIDKIEINKSDSKIKSLEDEILELDKKLSTNEEKDKIEDKKEFDLDEEFSFKAIDKIEELYEEKDIPEDNISKKSLEDEILESGDDLMFDEPEKIENKKDLDEEFSLKNINKLETIKEEDKKLDNKENQKIKSDLEDSLNKAIINTLNKTDMKDVLKDLDINISISFKDKKIE